MHTDDKRDTPADRESDPTYPFPTSDTTPSGREAPISILDSAPGARAGEGETRTEDLRAGLAERGEAASRGETPDATAGEDHEALVESETRVARARRSRHESAQREQRTQAVAAGSAAVVAAALLGFAAGVWWAAQRRPRLRFW
jgi:hypothetical protein